MAEKAHDISIALGVATMEATKKMFSFDILKKKTLWKCELGDGRGVDALFR